METRSRNRLFLAAAVLGILAVAWWIARSSQAPIPSEVPEGLHGRGPDPGHFQERVSEPPPPITRSEMEPQPQPVAPGPIDPGAAIIRARVVDDGGASFVGATLRALRPGQPSGETGPEGKVELSLLLDRGPAEGESVWVDFEVSHPDAATKWIGSNVVSGGVTHLGEIRLERGGAIEGELRVPGGKDLHDVEVFVLTPQDEARLWLSPSEVMRQVGPQLAQLVPREIPRVRAGPGGRFRVSGLPPGMTRIWAAAPLMLASFSEPVRVLAGSTVTCGSLVLEECGIEGSVRGRVLDPAGAGAPSVRVVAEALVKEKGAGTITDAQGRFVLAVASEPDTSTILADDPSGRWAPSASATGVAPGTVDLVLRLSEQRRMTVRVLDETERPLELFALSGHPQGRYGTLWQLPLTRRPGGVVEATVASEAFLLQAESPGYETATLGPWSGEPVPSEVVFRLAGSPGALHGRVVAEGNPVSGAKVTVLVQLEASQRLRHLNLASHPGPVWSRCSRVLARTEADHQGRFLAGPFEGTIAVRAEAPGWAPAIRWSLPGGSTEEVVLELDRGGALEGQVLVPGGVEPSGLIVAASCGDGTIRTVRTDGGGRYQMRSLVVGRHQVKILEGDLRCGEEVLASRAEAVPQEQESWECEVVRGTTTTLDLDLRGWLRPRLTGRLSVDSWDLGDWTVRLFLSSSKEREVGPIAVESDGSFRAQLPEVGEWTLEIAGKDPHGNELLIVDRLDVRAYEQGWDRHVSVAKLTGSAADPSVLWPDRRFACVARASSPRLVVVFLELDEGQKLKPAHVPSGSSHIVIVRRGERLDPDVDRPSACEVLAPAGGATDIHIP